MTRCLCNAGIFGGAGIFDIIANPVEAVPEADAPEQQDPGVGAWQETEIDSDGLPMTGNTKYKDRYWGGHRSTEDNAGSFNKAQKGPTSRSVTSNHPLPPRPPFSPHRPPSLLHGVAASLSGHAKPSQRAWDCLICSGKG